AKGWKPDEIQRQQCEFVKIGKKQKAASTNGHTAPSRNGSGSDSAAALPASASSIQHPTSNVQPTPRHVAVIMDGNGRWAQERGLSRQAGHRAGTENIRRIIQTFGERGVQVLT